MRRLRHRKIAVANAQARRHAEPADQAGRFVGQDVAEHIGRHHHVKILRVAYQPHRHRIDDDLVDSHVGKVLRGAITLLDEHAAAEFEHGVFMNQRQQLAPVPRQIQRDARHPLAADARDHAYRNRHVIGRPELARTGDDVAVGLKAFVVLAHDDQVDVVVQAADARVRARRPDVGKQVEVLAHDRMRIDCTWPFGVVAVADGAENEPVHFRQGFKRAFRQC